MRKFLALFFVLFLCVACSPSTPEPTGVDSLGDTAATESEPTPTMTTAQRAETPFDADLFGASVDQLLYVLPVTRSDVIDELSIILEGQTGEMVDLQTIRTCMAGYSESEGGDGMEESDREAIKERWATLLNPEALEGAIDAANQTFSGCVASDQSGCYQSCEAYAAAASTIKALPDMRGPSADE